MLILRNKEYSKNKLSIADQDYLDDREADKKSVKHAKAVGAALSGLMGASIGGSLGSMSRKYPSKGAAIGASLGAAALGTGGYFLGKKQKKLVEDKANKEIQKYLKSSDKDRRYLRERKDREKDLELKRRMADAQVTMAANSWRW